MNRFQGLKHRAIVAVVVAFFTSGVALAQQAAEVGTFDGHTDPVYSVAWTPGGKTLITGGFDNTVRVWDSATRKLLKTLTGHANLVLSVAPSPDGNLILSGSLDKTAKLWSFPKTGFQKDLNANPAGLKALALKPDGTWAAVATGNQVKIWDLNAGNALRDLNGHTAEVASVAFRGDGAQIASGDKARTIRLWNAADGAAQGSVETPADTVLALAYLPNNQQLVSSGSDGISRLWQLPFADPRTIDVKAPVVVAAFAANGAKFATSGDKIIRIWNPADSALLKEIDAGEPVTALSLSADGGQVAAGLANKTIRVFKTDSGEEVKKIEGLASPATAIALTPDAAGIAAATEDNKIAVYNVADPKDPKVLAGHEGRVTVLRFVPNDANLLVSGSADRSAKLWNRNEAKLVRDFKGHGDAVSGLAVSADGKTLVTASNDQTARAWNIADGKEGVTFKGHTSPVLTVSISPDGSKIATGAADKTTRFWEAATGRELQLLSTFGGPLVGVAIGADNKTVVAASQDQKAVVWATSAIRAFAGHQGPVFTVAVAPNGAQVITGAADKTVKVFDVNNGAVVRSLEGHGDAVRAVAFSKDGAKIVSGSLDKTVKIWNAADGKIIVTSKPLSQGVVALAVSADNKQIVAGLIDNKGKVLSLAATEQVKLETGDLEGHTGVIQGLAFLPDNVTIVTGAEDKTIKVWQPRPSPDTLRRFTRWPGTPTARSSPRARGISRCGDGMSRRERKSRRSRRLMRTRFTPSRTARKAT